MTGLVLFVIFSASSLDIDVMPTRVKNVSAMSLEDGDRKCEWTYNCTDPTKSDQPDPGLGTPFLHLLNSDYILSLSTQFLSGQENT